MSTLSRRSILFTFLLLNLLGWALVHPVQAQTEGPKVLVLTADGAVSSAMSGYLERGIRYAQGHGMQLIIFQLNTPGGSIDITNRMVQIMRGSPIPIVVYVSPRGAMAGSAGTVVTLAGHAAAMAPETAIGAASPVGPQGEDVGKTMELKTKEILKAIVRSLAERRGSKAVALAEQTIEEAKAVSATEALEIGLVDFIAEDVDDLLRQLDGFIIQISNTEVTLHTTNAAVIYLPNNLVEQVLFLMTNPNVVFLLLTIGVQAVLIELSSPGGWVAGFIGVVCLALAGYGLGLLPVNWFGLIFIATAFVLFFLDIKAPTHGALTTAGIGSFIAGALILFNSTEAPSFQKVSPPLVIGTALVTAATFAIAVGFAIRAQHSPIRTGHEALVGRTGTVRVALSPRGQVQMGGEMWSAEVLEGAEPIPAGTRVEVVAVDGIHLKVKPK
ncbi:MAG: nodulation protein NfeD [Anaerolineales bacterium]|nr:nodulation protein NfeD [Anaerolineales bacterium]